MNKTVRYRGQLLIAVPAHWTRVCLSGSGEVTKMDLATSVKISEIREEESYTSGGKITYNRGKQEVIKMGVSFGIGPCT